MSGEQPSKDQMEPSGEQVIDSPKESVRQRRRFGLWPIIETQEEAHWACKQAGITAFVVSAFSIAVIFWLRFGPSELREIYAVTPELYFCIIAFTAIGVFLWRNSRIAAVSGLSLYLLEKLHYWTQIKGSSILIVGLFILSFINGVRGAFAFHRFVASDKNSDMVNESSGTPRAKAESGAE